MKFASCLIYLCVSICAFAQNTCPATFREEGAHARRYRFEHQGTYLILEFLTDNLVHFEMSRVGTGPHDFDPMFTTPMVARTKYPGPTQVHQVGNRIETKSLIVTVQDNLCLSIHDRVRNVGLTTICPDQMDKETKRLAIDPFKTKHVYGLGQYFYDRQTADGDWVGRVWEPGPMGNTTKHLGDGIPSQAQFPIMYALGQGGENYALFLDQPYKLRWDFTTNANKHWWDVQTWGDQIRGYVIGGKDLPDLRRQFMDLTGRPQVPPKKTLGLWVSEFGYENWKEVDDILADLRAKGFPVDGFVMDLQWFGNQFNDWANSRMGSLRWDEKRFPNPAEKVRTLRQGGVDLMLIEQSYVSNNLPEHKDLEDKHFLARNHFNGPATFIDNNPWWGKGGLIDWSDPGAAPYWHRTRRKPLVDMGINFHWTDLGEPEMYNPWAVYHGIESGKHLHGDVHNMLTLLWLKGINDGYRDENNPLRSYSMSRSGTVGLQRHRAGMWSGDLGANLAMLKMHVNAHMHMSMAGVDYYSSDIGGFFQWSLDGKRNDLYSLWFAMGALLDTPVRPHTWNLDKWYDTSPAKVGHVPSNLANIRQRYEMIPYYYSLAHRAHLFGEPIMPPPVFYYQTDANVGRVGNQMMIGRDLMMGVVATYGETERNVYLPAGRWTNFHTHQSFTSNGQHLDNVPVFIDGILRLPLFARAGAIIPMSRVTASTKNVFDLHDLVARVYADETESSFTLFEDDGVTIKDDVRMTPISQRRVGDKARVTVHPVKGGYLGQPTTRNVEVELVVDNAEATEVTWNGVRLEKDKDWSMVSPNLILAKASKVSFDQELRFEFTLKPVEQKATVYFVCKNGETANGEALYVLGDIPELGGWDPARAVKLEPNPYPVWTGRVTGLPVNKAFEWRCIKRREDGGPVLQWDPVQNHHASTGTGQPYVAKGSL